MPVWLVTRAALLGPLPGRGVGVDADGDLAAQGVDVEHGLAGGGVPLEEVVEVVAGAGGVLREEADAVDVEGTGS